MKNPHHVDHGPGASGVCRVSNYTAKRFICPVVAVGKNVVKGSRHLLQSKVSSASYPQGFCCAGVSWLKLKSRRILQPIPDVGVAYVVTVLRDLLRLDLLAYVCKHCMLPEDRVGDDISCVRGNSWNKDHSTLTSGARRG